MIKIFLLIVLSGSFLAEANDIKYYYDLLNSGQIEEGFKVLNQRDDYMKYTGLRESYTELKVFKGKSYNILIQKDAGGGEYKIKAYTIKNKKLYKISAKRALPFEDIENDFDNKIKEIHKLTNTDYVTEWSKHFAMFSKKNKVYICDTNFYAYDSKNFKCIFSGSVNWNGVGFTYTSNKEIKVESQKTVLENLNI